MLVTSVLALNSKEYGQAGDFHQLSPARGPALWKEPRTGNSEDANGRIIWHQFTDIIILDQQMRQAEDAPFRDLVGRARAATLTEDDLALLNSKTTTSPLHRIWSTQPLLLSLMFFVTTLIAFKWIALPGPDPKDLRFPSATKPGQDYGSVLSIPRRLAATSGEHEFRACGCSGNTYRPYYRPCYREQGL